MVKYLYLENGMTIEQRKGGGRASRTRQDLNIEMLQLFLWFLKHHSIKIQEKVEVNNFMPQLPLSWNALGRKPGLVCVSGYGC